MSLKHTMEKSSALNGCTHTVLVDGCLDNQSSALLYTLVFCMDTA